jgi:hypothetical protein
MNRKSERSQDTWIAIGLLALTLFSRIPFRTHILYHWDSVNFAYAMREFDLTKEQPQPPGYIVYVWLCRLVDVVVHDAQTAMVVIGIAASALAVVALFYLGRAMFGRRTGLIAALFLLTSPLFWFYGEIALPHSVDAMLVIVSVWWLHEVMQGNHRYLYPAVAVLAIAGGVRQQTIIFLAPVLLFALRRVGWKRFLAAGALGAVICLSWFIPLMALSGGFSTYMQIMGAFGGRFQDTTSVLMEGGWWGIGRNLRKLTMYTLFGWAVALVPAVIYPLSRLWRREWPKCWEKLVFLFLWFAPSWLFYVLIHMGQQGLVFVFLPSLLLLGAAGLERLLATRPRWLTPAVAILVALNVAVFGLAPEYPFEKGSLRLLTRATLANSDRYFQDRFDAIERNLSPGSTAILAASWHHVEYYLPGYVRLPFEIGSKWEVDAGHPKGNPQDMDATPGELGLQVDGHGRARVVVFDPDLMAFNETPASVHELPLAHGGGLDYFELTADQVFHYGARSFGVVGH